MKLKKSINGLKNIKGTIVDVSTSDIKFQTDKIEINIPYSQIQKANLNKEIKV